MAPRFGRRAESFSYMWGFVMIRSAKFDFPRRLPVFFLMFGMLLATASAGLFAWCWNSTADLVATSGEVVTYRDRRPVVSYQAFGEEFEILGPRYQKSPWRVGESIIVLYSPDDPNQSRFTSPLLQWWFPLFFGFVGLRFAYAAAKGMVMEGRMVKASAVKTASP